MNFEKKSKYNECTNVTLLLIAALFLMPGDLSAQLNFPSLQGKKGVSIQRPPPAPSVPSAPNVGGIIDDARNGVGTVVSHGKQVGGHVSEAYKTHIKAPIERILNLQCAIPFVNWVNAVNLECTAEQGEGWTRNLSDARVWLVQQGHFSWEDFAGVNVAWCNGIAAGASAMVPVPNKILFARNLENWTGIQLVPTLAHEMVHVKQIRAWGYEAFACQYSTELLKGRGTGRGNHVESEAYEFEDRVSAHVSNQIHVSSVQDAAYATPSIQARSRVCMGNVVGNAGELFAVGGGTDATRMRHAGWDDKPEASWIVAGRHFDVNGFWLVVRPEDKDREFFVGVVRSNRGELYRVKYGEAVQLLGGMGWDGGPGELIGRYFDPNGFWVKVR